MNTGSGVYHKSGRYFGKTKEGKFMTEADAEEGRVSRSEGRNRHQEVMGPMDLKRQLRTVDVQGQVCLQGGSHAAFPVDVHYRSGGRGTG